MSGAAHRHSFEVRDEKTAQVLASCDLMGSAAFTIHDALTNVSGA